MNYFIHQIIQTIFSPCPKPGLPWTLGAKLRFHCVKPQGNHSFPAGFVHPFCFF